MLHRHRTGDPTRKVTPPGPTFMSNEQVANYLKDLRQNRPTRPNGSRPLPSKAGPISTQEDKRNPSCSSSAISISRSPDVGSWNHLADDKPFRSRDTLSHHRNSSEISVGGSTSHPLAQQPPYVVHGDLDPGAEVLRTSISNPPVVYRENGQRWMEKQEARSLRDALEEMDLQDEIRLHSAAQDEATKLVWEHQNPGAQYKNPYAPYSNPDLNPVNRFRQHLEKGNHARSYSSSCESVSADKSPSHEQRSTSDEPLCTKWRNQCPETTKDSCKMRIKDGSLTKKSRVNFALPPEHFQPENSHLASSTRRRTVSGDSSKGIFRNPEDYIYEEPEDAKNTTDRSCTSNALSNALKPKSRNSLPQSWQRSSGQVNNPLGPRVWSVDIHKNTPSQSRNPLYITNVTSAPNDSVPEEMDIHRKNGIEIRADDIRAATSKKMTDRSTRLPKPTAVSDRPGQPIVSFDPLWTSHEDQPKASPFPYSDSHQPQTAFTDPTTSSSQVPLINVSVTPSIPTINLPEDKNTGIPEISVLPLATENSDSVKSTNCSSRDIRHMRSEPSKMPTTSGGRWYSPFQRTTGPTATCSNCSLPIAGKIVTAAGLRFHSECFSCHYCSTPLECVAFYEEPEPKRAERLASSTESDEETRALRFYCHLDFHELFSPRCKSCKTPIEGEVVVACGAEWHVGHFFCAECGDPFAPEIPFVEKDGFAWCLRCHSRRTASRCIGCKQPVLDEVVVSALGGQWHDRCFTCHECGGGFGPDGRFFVKEGEPKRTVKGRIITAPVQLAVCEGCEVIRLKA